ncbi:outer membrane protein assembly factor BamB family protein [Chitinophaga rhizosphaerae]|uniref:outer membrane protein assembly factor BamB family protein n=1 Tax=Chitinophaga rhizosphaerae TaxID=1864947 RepID=UPI000F809B08|nr:PQQ-binding-like beta-propeller repeat protein [Chitinophaga rhizosphaerae]
MKTCLAWLLGALLLSGTATAQDTLFRFALVTDTHVGTETGLEDLERTIRDLNQLPGIDFVIFSGDITEFGSDAELKIAKQAIDKLGKPWHVIPGNHDTKWSESGCNSFRTVFGSETFLFDHKGYRFIGTNSGPNMRMGPGQVPRENMVWLRKTLDRTPASIPIVYINHYPLDEGLNNWLDVYGMLREKNVQLMLCGHGHANRTYTRTAIPNVMCRSNLRAKDSVGGYNLVTVRRDSVLFAERRPSVQTLTAWHRMPLVTGGADKYPPIADNAAKRVNDSFPNVKIKWQIQENGDMGSAVAIAGGKVIYTTTNGDIKAADLQTGKLRWRYKAGGKIYATPLVHAGKVIVPCSDGKVYCLQLSNGRRAWIRETGMAIVSSPARAGNLAIIAGSDGYCRAWDIATGEIAWERPGIKGFAEMRPLVYGNKVLFGTWGNRFYALDAQTGDSLWQWSNGAANRMFSPAAVWPVATRNRAWIVSPDRFMTVVDTENGQQIWRFRDDAQWVRESIGMSEDSSRVYAKTMQGNILAFDAGATERKVVWQSPVQLGYEICPTPIAEKDGVVFIAGQSGLVCAISATDGALRWKHQFSNCLVNTVQPLAGNRVLASSMDGKLVCLEVTP